MVLNSRITIGVKLNACVQCISAVKGQHILSLLSVIPYFRCPVLLLSLSPVNEDNNFCSDNNYDNCTISA